MYRGIINYLGYDRFGNSRIRLKPHHFVLGYVAAGILTFGYDTANYPVMRDDDGCTSARVAQAIANRISSKDAEAIVKCPGSRDVDKTTMNGLAAAVGWPLFWSWEIME